MSLQGFDEYMNLVLDDAEEVSVKRKTRKAVGKNVLAESFYGRSRFAIYTGRICTWKADLYKAQNLWFTPRRPNLIGNPWKYQMHLASEKPAWAVMRSPFWRDWSWACQVGGSDNCWNAGRILLKGDNITLMQTTYVPFLASVSHSQISLALWTSSQSSQCKCRLNACIIIINIACLQRPMIYRMQLIHYMMVRKGLENCVG